MMSPDFDRLNESIAQLRIALDPATETMDRLVEGWRKFDRNFNAWKYRKAWLREYREARITRGHSGTAADAIFRADECPDSLEVRANLLTSPGIFLDAKHRTQVWRAWRDRTVPNLPGWW